MNVTVLHYYSYRIVLIDIALRTNPSPPRRVGKCEEVLRGIIVVREVCVVCGMLMVGGYPR